CKRRQARGIRVSITGNDLDILSLDIAEVAQVIEKYRCLRCEPIPRSGYQIGEEWAPAGGLLRSCRERPCRRRTGAEQSDELASSHAEPLNPRVTAYHICRNAALCITAKLAAKMQRWVNRYTCDPSRRPVYVRFTPNRWGNRPTSLWI